MQGIWAAAPSLHNGSVPTLAELLKPPAERVKSFKIDPAFDADNIGLAADRVQFEFTLSSTDCSDIRSGSRRCFRKHGTWLTPN